MLLTPYERANKRIYKESFTTYSATVTHASVMLGVKSVEERTIDKICGPNH
jgi:hypothetical protein